MANRRRMADWTEEEVHEAVSSALEATAEELRELVNWLKREGWRNPATPAPALAREEA